MQRLLLLCFLALSLALHARDKRVHIEFVTTVGTFTVALNPDTPQHSRNFEKLVREGFYDGILFHRVIRDFMVQAGDPDSKTAQPGQTLGEGDLPYTLPLELDLPYYFHHRGALAAARQGDDVNPERRSSATQFYIVWGKTYSLSRLAPIIDQVEAATGLQDVINGDMARTYETEGGTPFLDGQYTVFGEVTAGLSVIDRMQQVTTDSNDRPIEDVRILTARVKE